MGKYMVKVGYHVSYGPDAQNVKEYIAGDTVDMSDDDVKRYGDALEPVNEETVKALAERRKEVEEEQREKMGPGGGIDPLFTGTGAAPTAQASAPTSEQHKSSSFFHHKKGE